MISSAADLPFSFALESTSLLLQIQRRDCEATCKELFDHPTDPDFITQYEVKIHSKKVRAEIAVGCGGTPEEALKRAYNLLLKREAAFG